MKEIVGLRLEFFGNVILDENELLTYSKMETIGTVDLSPDWVKIVKWLWTSIREQLNVTVIEFSPTALSFIHNAIRSPSFGIPEKNAKVTLYDYNCNTCDCCSPSSELSARAWGRTGTCSTKYSG